MSELLSENYQSGIYWAALNAEQARERAANAELDYWTKRAEKDGLVLRVERTNGPNSTEDDGVRAGRKEIQAPPVAPGEQPRDPLDDNYQTWIAAQPPAQERASDILEHMKLFANSPAATLACRQRVKDYADRLEPALRRERT